MSSSRVNVFVDASFDPMYTNLAVAGCSTGMRDVPMGRGKFKRGVHTRCLGHIQGGNIEAEYRAIFMAIELYADKYDYVYIYTDCEEAAGDPTLEALTNIRVVYIPAKWKRDRTTPENRIFGSVDAAVRGQMRKARDELLGRSRSRRSRKVRQVVLASTDHFDFGNDHDDYQPITQEDMSDDEDIDDIHTQEDPRHDIERSASSCVLL